MPHLLMRWRLRDEQIEALIEKHQNREDIVRNFFADFGGNMQGYYYVLGSADGLAIAEFPDNESIAACTMRAIATGAFFQMDTTILLTRSEAQLAMSRAGGTKTTFRPPVERAIP